MKNKALKLSIIGFIIAIGFFMVANIISLPLMNTIEIFIVLSLFFIILTLAYMHKKTINQQKSANEIQMKLLSQVYTRVVKADLVKGTATFLYDTVYTEKIGETIPYEMALDEFLESEISKSDYENAKKVLSISSLKDFLNLGKDKEALEFRSKSGDFLYEWKELIISKPMQNEKNSVYLLLKNINEQKLMNSIINQFVYENCDYFIFLDVKNDRYTMFSYSDNGTPLPPTVCNSYSTEIIKYAQTFVSKEDVDYVIEQMNLDTVIKDLDEKGEHIFYTGIDDPIYGYTRKALKYVYYDKENQMVLLVRTDVTDMYNNEHEKQKLLELALKSEESANKAKTTFLAQMSHELRTPLNAVIGLDEIMQSNLNNTDFIMDCLEKSKSSAKYLLAILNDILDMSAIENNRLKLENHTFSLSELYNDINTILAPQINVKSINFTAKANTDLNQCYIGDKTRIQQILLNILYNAIKFTPKCGNVSFGVRDTQIDGMNNLEFTIIDNGIGIDSEFLPHIFDLFLREHSSSTSRFGGSGLGLSISKYLVTLMNGDITVKSKAGEGSAFTVTIPLIKARNNIITPADNNESDFETLNGKQVLLVEDQPLNAMIAKKILEKAHITVTIAENGKIGVDKFINSQKNYYDAILMDIRMPVMDGFEATKAIRNLCRNDAKDIPIIAVTANTFAEDIKKSFDVGMDAHLSKPIEPNMLYQTILEKICSKNILATTGL